jgi:uncharacterized protein (DUF427 family)
MATLLDRAELDLLGVLRTRPTPFRIRGYAGSELVLDSRAARLVWRPRWATPVYAVPFDDVRVPVEPGEGPRELTDRERRRRVLDPSVPFDAHTCPGRVVVLRTASGPVAGFVCDDPDLADVVLVDFAGLSWREEEQEMFAHPRDPSQRIDVRPTSAHLRLSHRGRPLVDTRRARLLWETVLPVRWYVPAEDVLVPLEPSGTVTWCAYKGRATYRTLVVDDHRLPDLAWVYERPLSDAEPVRGLLGFWDERVDVEVDGVPQPRRQRPLGV